MPSRRFPDEDLAARVRAVRAYANFTRKELAAAIDRPDISERVLAGFENPYKTAPSLEQLDVIASACGLPPTFFEIDFAQANDVAPSLRATLQELRVALDAVLGK
jgi:transcriptional regulator with XRE-family HTH domain